jgi:HlyD family secretion protein
MAAIASLPFIHTGISVKTTGITRPVSERTEVKPVISGIIQNIYCKEGDKVAKDAVILRLKDPNTQSKRTLNNYEIQQRQQFIHDLEILTASPPPEGGIFSPPSEGAGEALQSPLYKEQFSKFLHQKEQQEFLLNKANKEVEMNAPLAKEKILSAKEFFDIQNNQQQVQSSYKAFVREQQSQWQQDLSKYKLELSEYQQQGQQINADAAYYEVKAPTQGIVQGINDKYAGGFVQTNETVCTISPEGSLVGECYVQSKDVGLLQVGQPARFQIEAYNYNYFGVLTGKIISIDNDFTVVNNTPVIKVRCSFDSTQLHLKNGFTGHLQKGLNFQASFMVARRSLWQLLYDKLDDWLNPNAPSLP